eukprot:TRINITY_DN4348_c0_g2_i20.p1 TRINITY_DN4348_c0_g2~~TRINITY_DN4348_c0_g2_i20.p1  ORF type:complete len:105 (-),score=24.87 TRINITY_DN4348_c0_g2_i20:91-405(-)
MLHRLSGKEFTTEEVQSVLSWMDKEGNERITFDNFLYKIRNLAWLLDPSEAAKYRSEIVDRRPEKKTKFRDVGTYDDPFVDTFSFSVGVVCGFVACWVAMTLLF